MRFSFKHRNILTAIGFLFLLSGNQCKRARRQGNFPRDGGDSSEDGPAVQHSLDDVAEPSFLDDIPHMSDDSTFTSKVIESSLDHFGNDQIKPGVTSAKLDDALGDQDRDDVFTRELLGAVQRLQAKPQMYKNIADSMSEMLSQLAMYKPMVPQNYVINQQTDFDDDCFRKPGQLNHFFNRLTKLFNSNDGDSRVDKNDAGSSLENDMINPTSDDLMDDTKSEEYIIREKRNTSPSKFDLVEAMDEMEVVDVECLKNFLSPWEREELCSYFSKTFSGIFAKLYASGFACSKLLEMDDINDDGLDMQHQIIMESQFRSQPTEDWSDEQVKRLMTLAPDALGEDFIEDLPDNLFKTNLRVIGRLAAGKDSNPSLREAFREKLEDIGLKTLSAEGIQRLGPGLLALTLDQLSDMDGNLFINAEIDDLLDEDNDSDDIDDNINTNAGNGDDNDEDDDDNEEEDGYFMRYTIGQMMKKAVNSSVFGNSQLIARTLPFLNNDLDFIHKLDPEALYNALPQLQHIDFDHEEAVEMIEKLRERMNILQNNQGNVVRQLGHLMKGLHATEIEELEKEDLEDAVEDLKDIDFDDEQAEAIIDQILDENKILTYGNVMNLGKLVKGLSVHHIQKMGSQDLSQVIDFRGLHFNPVKQNLIAEKLRDDGFSVKSMMPLYEILSDDDLEDLFEEDMSKFMEYSSKVKWQPEQAVTVATLIKQYMGSQNLSPTDLMTMPYVAVGLLPSDIDDMAISDDDSLDLIEMFEDVHEDLTSALVDILKEKLMEIKSDDEDSMLPVNQKIALQGSTIMAYLDKDDFGKLEFDTDGKDVFLAQIYKVSTKKMSRSHLEDLAENVLSLTGHKNVTPYSNLRILGQTALGLTPRQLSSMGGKAIIDNLDIIRNLPFSKKQAEAILDVVDRDEPDWTCRSDILARLGPLLQHADDALEKPCLEALLASMPAIMKGLAKNRESVKERMEEGFAREEDKDNAIDEDGTARLVSFMIEAYNKPQVTRQRRSVGRRSVSSDTLSCSLVQQLRGSAVHIPLEYLQKFSTRQMTTCLSEIGSISDWKQSAIQILINQLKSAEGKVSEWREETVRRAGSLTAGLSPSEIQQMRITGVDTLNSIGKHKRMNKDQLKAGVQRWMALTQKKSASDITEGELASLSEFVCGLEPSEIIQLSNVAFRRSLKVIGHSTSCSLGQTTAYVSKLISVYRDNVKLWKPALVAEIGHLLGHLGRDRLQSLTPDQLSLVSPKVIQNLPVHAILALQKSQLKSLGTNQINAITNEQFYSLSETQQRVVAPKASVAFHHQDNAALPISTANFLLVVFPTIIASIFSV